MSAELWTEKRYAMPAWTQAFATDVLLIKGDDKNETGIGYS